MDQLLASLHAQVAELMAERFALMRANSMLVQEAVMLKASTSIDAHKEAALIQEMHRLRSANAAFASLLGAAAAREAAAATDTMKAVLAQKAAEAALRHEISRVKQLQQRLATVEGTCKQLKWTTAGGRQVPDKSAASHSLATQIPPRAGSSRDGDTIPAHNTVSSSNGNYKNGKSTRPYRTVLVTRRRKTGQGGVAQPLPPHVGPAGLTDMRPFQQENSVHGEQAVIFWSQTATSSGTAPASWISASCADQKDNP